VAGVDAAVVFIDDYQDKIYRLEKLGILVGNTGLLEFGGRSVKDWLLDLQGSVSNVQALAQLISSVFPAELAREPADKVIFERRDLDVLLVPKPSGRGGSPPIVGVGCRPNNGQIVPTITKLSECFAAIGDAEAKAALGNLVAPMKYSNQTAVNLEREVRRLTQFGIDHCGKLPNYGHATCGGRPIALVLRA